MFFRKCLKHTRGMKKMVHRFVIMDTFKFKTKKHGEINCYLIIKCLFSKEKWLLNLIYAMWCVLKKEKEVSENMYVNKDVNFMSMQK